MCSNIATRGHTKNRTGGDKDEDEWTNTSLADTHAHRRTNRKIDKDTRINTSLQTYLFRFTPYGLAWSGTSPIVSTTAEYENSHQTCQCTAEGPISLHHWSSFSAVSLYPWVYVNMRFTFQTPCTTQFLCCLHGPTRCRSAAISLYPFCVQQEVRKATWCWSAFLPCLIISMSVQENIQLPNTNTGAIPHLSHNIHECAAGGPIILGLTLPSMYSLGPVITKHQHWSGSVPCLTISVSVQHEVQSPLCLTLSWLYSTGPVIKTPSDWSGSVLSQNIRD